MNSVVVIDPSDDVSWSNLTPPVIFLAGPIQGAPSWHADAIAALSGAASRRGLERLLIASPKRRDWPAKDAYDFARQVEWETEWLGWAAQTGCIMFWLAKAIENDPDRSYAQTTRFELGNWYSQRWKYERNGMVVGIEPGFHGERYIRHMLRDETVYSYLESTCTAAITRVLEIE